MRRAADGKLAEELDGGVDGDQDRCGQGDEAKDENPAAGKEHRIGKQQGVDRPARPQEENPVEAQKVIEGEGQKAVQHPAEKVEEQEFLAADRPLDGQAKEEQPHHVEEKVPEVRMSEQVGHRLPEEMVAQEQDDVQRKDVLQAGRKAGQQEYHGVDQDKDQGRVPETIAEGLTDDTACHTRPL